MTENLAGETTNGFDENEGPELDLGQEGASLLARQFRSIDVRLNDHQNRPLNSRHFKDNVAFPAQNAQIADLRFHPSTSNRLVRRL